MKKLLLIHCGGTLGMVEGDSGFTTQRGNLKRLISSNPRLASKYYFNNNEDIHNQKDGGIDTFITPILMNGTAAIVDLYEFPKIIDSSEASLTEWCMITETIHHFYSNYDGFVVIHGTDTLSYAASCLSFMINGLTVPVIFTGSVLPMNVEDSDAEDNLIGAIQSCMLSEFPGVYLFFNSWLHHGARTTKISSDSFDCFYSSNPIRIEDLAQNYFTKNFSFGRQRNARPIFYSSMSHDVGIFKNFPTIQTSHFLACLAAYKAVILETYGSGTFPNNRKDLLNVIQNYIEKGGIVINVSQCTEGNVSSMYEANNMLSKVGVIPAKNMTTESAFAKLSLLLAYKVSKIKEWFEISICGEIDEKTDTQFHEFNNYTHTFNF